MDPDFGDEKLLCGLNAMRTLKVLSRFRRNLANILGIPGPSRSLSMVKFVVVLRDLDPEAKAP